MGSSDSAGSERVRYDSTLTVFMSEQTRASLWEAVDDVLSAQDINDVLGGVAPMFNSVIRHSESVAVEAREAGDLVHEIAERVDNAEPFWIALKKGEAPKRVAGTAPALADDYVLLTQEILTRIGNIEAQESAST